MRVIAGRARGRPLLAPKGAQTRPTSDLIRGVIFNLLAQEVDDLGEVLDLYAGSGALGIEALSRGAERVTFVERNPTACRVISENLHRLDLAEGTTIVNAPVKRALTTLNGAYTIILLDPPYADSEIDEVLAQLAASSLVGSETIVVVEHSKHREPEGPGLMRVKRRCHGDTCVSIFRRVE
ncbi:MAG: 16S rRNA (guanine(966)-N(2))-methyltransferase RsmD [Dehalococcoidia bacterium]